MLKNNTNNAINCGKKSRIIIGTVNLRGARRNLKMFESYEIKACILKGDTMNCVLKSVFTITES